MMKRERSPLGLYVHIPFCRQKCAYCDFVSFPEQGRADAYFQALYKEIAMAAAECGSKKFDTVFFGGGTPSAVPLEFICTAMERIRACFDLEISEATIECNPGTVDMDKLKAYRRAGFNRISIGVQSFDDGLLRSIGRIHSAAQAEEAVKLSRAAGFENINIDLMYGLPGQDLLDWTATLDNVLRLNPEHISCYALKVEEGTPFYQVKDALNLPDEDTQADMYLAAVETLKGRSFRQYEISNFCRKGLVSRHNMKYWTGGEYLGFGPGASSDFAGKRYTLKRDLQAYISGIRDGGDIMEDLQEIPIRERAGEYLMLRLRTSQGIEREEYEKTFLLPFDPLEDVLEKQRRLFHATQTDTGRWVLTPKGYLVSNDIITDLLLAQDNSAPLKRV